MATEFDWQGVSISSPVAFHTDSEQTGFQDLQNLTGAVTGPTAPVESNPAKKSSSLHRIAPNKETH